MRPDRIRGRHLGALLMLLVVLGTASSGSASDGGARVHRPRSVAAAGLRGRVHGLTRELVRIERSVERRGSQIRRLRRRRRRCSQLLRAQTRTITPIPPEIRSSGPAATASRRSGVAVTSLLRRRARFPQQIAWRRRSVARLRRRARRLEARIRRVRPLGVCPVERAVAISDDFGAPRFDHGRYHAHQGNDISAPFGSPIVAPFDGRAAAATNELGGLAVDVYGPAGHVYNAHLSKLGQLGRVAMGTVIGYVGASGNATSFHDHFEWHPMDGPAVDPHVLLSIVCDT